ncbi:MAG TPA: hypothetical protein VFN09_05030 [Rhodanobacteraceae bacterium]|nr:hypothetical protein [Rhodanobacteraceae bacterium]
MTDATQPMPVAFLGHGSPMNALETNRYWRAWQALGGVTARYGQARTGDDDRWPAAMNVIPANNRTFSASLCLVMSVPSCVAAASAPKANTFGRLSWHFPDARQNVTRDIYPRCNRVLAFDVWSSGIQVLPILLTAE